MKDEESEHRVLWQDTRNILYLSRKTYSRWCFELLERKEGGHTVKIAAWDQDVKNVEDLCVLSEGEEIQVIWHKHHTVHRETVAAQGTHHSSTVLRVDFIISFIHVIWSSGLLLVEEKSTCNLHIFDTSTMKCLGYITLQADSQSLLPLGSPMRFDHYTGILWCLVRRYDELTKSATAHLNCYTVARFSLCATFEMPRGFTNYALVKLRNENQGLTHVTDIATVLCSHILLPDFQLLHFAGPTKPYLQENFHDHKFIVHFLQDDFYDRDFQPQTPWARHEPCNQVVPTDTNVSGRHTDPWQG